MTHDLVEHMVGHRTRLAQQPPDRWHDGEDDAAARYVDLSRVMDHAAVVLAALPRAFLPAGVAALAPAFVAGAPGAGSLAIGIGATVLAYRALQRLAVGVTVLTGAWLTWEKVKPLWDAAGRDEPAAEPLLALAPRPPSGALMEAHDLSFRYRERGREVLRGVTLRVAPGDRLLLEGGSGGGKSTLGAVLAGLRAPASGLLLLGGLDRRTLGRSGFRRLVVSSPQFHENHVLTATFSFNLLMGRAWPPERADVEEAQRICEELDLGGLLARMPAGLDQMVGETGWQLSHGERSRLFIARALLQRAELLVLDESFAALDPATLDRALRCVLSRARALLVIAHP
jgi:ATP-binding cassette subfamily B protein